MGRLHIRTGVTTAQQRHREKMKINDRTFDLDI